MPSLDAYESERTLSRELEHGERLLWSGRPNPTRAAVPMIGCWIMAVPWTAFSLFWMWAALGFGKRLPDEPFEWFFPLFGVPFVLVGFAMLSAPLWAYRAARRTVHGVTDRRILTVVEGRARKVTSYLPRDIGELERTERPDGSGDLIFSRRTYRDSDGDRRTNNLGLYGVQDVRTAERVIRETLLGGGRKQQSIDDGTEKI